MSSVRRTFFTMKSTIWSKISVCVLCALNFCHVAQAAPTSSTKPLTATTKTPRKLALLVGISHYDRGRGEDKDWWNLDCQTDIATMKRVLESRFGFAAKDILVLEDAQATKKGILDAWQHHLIDQARPGDIIVFHYSGHGQEVPDPTHRKMSGMHQAIIPFDYIDQSAQSGLKADVLDDDIRDSLRRLKAKMQDKNGQVQGNITVFLDSCFSGTATRGGNGLPKRGRGWNPKIDGPKPLQPTRGANVADASDWLGKDEAVAQGYVVIAATRSDQIAQEAANDRNQPMGALTLYLTRALENATPQTTYRALFETVSAQVENAVDNQNPQMEGDADKLLFSGTARPAGKYLVVSQVNGTLVTLPTGFVQGASVGSTFNLYRAGSDVNDAKNLLATATITSVDDFTSQAKLDIEYSKVPSADLVAARAIETAHNYGDNRLKAFLDGSGDWVQKLKAAQKSANEDESLSVMDDSATRQNCDVSIVQVGHQLEVQRRSDHQIVARINNDEKMFDEMRKALNAEWRWQFLNRLGNSPSTQSLLQIEMQLVPVKGANDPTPRSDIKPNDGNNLVFKEGDSYTLKLRNLSPVDAYVTVLDLPPDGSINPVLPPDRQPIGELNRIPADGQWHVIKGLIATASEPYGRERWKAIATQQPADFSALWVQKVPGADNQILCSSSRGGAPSNPLSQMLLSSATRRRGAALAPPAYWTTAQVTFEVVPATL